MRGIGRERERERWKNSLEAKMDDEVDKESIIR